MKPLPCHICGKPAARSREIDFHLCEAHGGPAFCLDGNGDVRLVVPGPAITHTCIRCTAPRTPPDLYCEKCQASGWSLRPPESKPGPAITQGPDDVGDAAALIDAEHARRDMNGVLRSAPAEILAAVAHQEPHQLRLGDTPPAPLPPMRPTLNRHPGELALELLRYASANAPGGELQRPLTAYETHLAGHLAAFINFGMRQAVCALEGNDAMAAELFKSAMASARLCDQARRVVMHEDAMRPAPSACERCDGTGTASVYSPSLGTSHSFECPSCKGKGVQL